MELLTEELRRGLPALYSQEGNPDPVVHIKFFTPDSNWTWYVTDGSAEGGDFLFFGYVIGFEREWGYFHLSELMESLGPMGLPIERDLILQTRSFQSGRSVSRALKIERVGLPYPLFISYDSGCV